MVGRSGPVGFGLVGCGVIAPTHAQAIAGLAGARLVAATDLEPARAEALVARFGGVATSDLGELLAMPEVDVVTVCVPSGRHAEVGVAAAQAGKHVLVEKPIDISLEAADRLIAACEEAGVCLAVVSQHRFDPGVVELRRLLAAGALGRLVLGDARVKWYRTQGYYDSGDWRGTWALDGGGALINQGVHYTDLLRWMLGPVREVTALCVTQSHDIEVEDVALAMIRFASGAVGTLEATTAVYPGLAERLEVSGTQGTAIIEDGNLVLLETMAEGAELGAYGARIGTVGDPAAGNARSDPGAVIQGAHVHQIADLIDALAEGRPPSVTGQDGRDALALVVAVYESARLGRPISLT